MKARKTNHKAFKVAGATSIATTTWNDDETLEKTVAVDQGQIIRLGHAPPGLEDVDESPQSGDDTETGTAKATSEWDVAMNISQKPRSRKRDYCYRSTAIRMLGLTSTAFAKLKLKPAEIVPNPHHKSSEAQLFDKAKIEALVNAPKVEALRPRPRHPRDYPSMFRRKYANPRAAVLDACHAMFNLNRYCKHHSCSAQNMEQIYGLKNRLIHLLYENGYATETYRHELHHPEQPCWRCGGTGDGYDYDEPICPHCDGTGVWRSARTEIFLVFRFCIAGEFFTWHQPEDLVNYQVRLTGGTTPMPEIVVKPLEMPRNKLTEARKLVEWVLDGWDKGTGAQSDPADASECSHKTAAERN